MDLLKLQQGGAAVYLFLARRERSWLFDPPRVYEPGSYENLCWLAFQNQAGWPSARLFLHVEVCGRTAWEGVTLLDCREAARDLRDNFPPCRSPSETLADEAVSPKSSVLFHSGGHSIFENREVKKMDNSGEVADLMVKESIQLTEDCC